MKDNELRELIEQLRESSLYHDERLLVAFEKVRNIYISACYPNGYTGNSLMCSIHDLFPSHHSCIGCNLHDNNRLVERFLLHTENLSDIQYTFTTYLLLLYLTVERIHEYFSLIDIPESYRLRHFQVFQEVKYWANFLKHPKAFMLVLHPSWDYSEPDVAKSTTAYKAAVVIDTAFVKEFYSGASNNNKLYAKLARNGDVLVLFPNPIELTKRFTEALQKFVSLIAENEMVREMLESKTRNKEHFTVNQPMTPDGASPVAAVA